METACVTAQEINAEAIQDAFDDDLGVTVDVTGIGPNYTIEFTGDPNTDVGDITATVNELTAMTSTCDTRFHHP